MRSIDHLVMPFDALGAARQWFMSLGFLVAPEAAHPFGTGNACVFLADGCYIEPLAIVDPAAYDAAKDEGHLFIERDAAMRDLPERPAISGLAFRSSDALADREQLLEEEAGEEGLVEFGRTMRLPDGRTVELSFRLAFAAIHAADAPSFFYCEARHTAKPDRSALTTHPNGATGIAGVTVEARDPQMFRDYLASVADSEVQGNDDGADTVPLDGGRLDVVAGGPSPLAIDSLTVTVADLAFAKKFWQGQGIAYSEAGDGVAIACPNGRGAIRFIEERS
ncbi:VOC family protein [Jiella avicenniae]|uniref:VOC family protein n=1 Tax=Jiella avicenniae TaxID=2907202 RepID=A0A9X1NYD1_9HYPH|nr:VOC family protein [Jiella avicenniae]MCE7027782.1 VOC family protein [Jiella avicenniae]